MRALLVFWFAALLATAVAGAAPYDDVHLPGANYVNNGGFERGLDGWEVFAGRSLGGVVSDSPHRGRSCLRLSGVNEDYRYLNQTPIMLQTGRTYTLSAWIRCQGFKRAGDNAQVVNLTNYGWTKSAQLSPAQAEGDWTRYTTTFEAFPTAEANGRPSYTLCVFWPVGSEGTVWIDDIQIEEGTTASDFTDRCLGWALEALAGLRRLRPRAEAAGACLAGGFEGNPAPAALTARAAAVLQAADAVAARLRNYGQVPLPEAQALPGEVARLDGEVTALGQAYFLANPYLPLGELAVPGEPPADLRVAWTCLQGEQRATALAVANVSPDAAVVRVTAGELYDQTRGVRLPGVPWLQGYNVPLLRGFRKPWEQYTDPLVKLDEAGLWPQPAGRLSEIVLVADTSRLLPGTYRGTAALTCLSAQAPARQVGFSLEVLPLRLPEPGVDICDIGMVADYATASLTPLRVNTFTVSAQWLVPTRRADGSLAVDFARVRPLVRPRLQHCPTARFWLGFGAGEVVLKHLAKLNGVPIGDARLDAPLAEWIHAIVAGFGEMGVGPERLVLETVDEPGEGQLALAARLATVLKRAEPKLRTHSYVTSFRADSPDHQKLYAALDITAPAFTAINDQSVDYLRRAGKQVWVYDCQNSAETFHPVTYNRLLPWLAWRYKLDGWGHFSMLDSARGRGYEPWEGVAQEAEVYPAAGEGQVSSRRLLALQAGTEDYCVLKQLSRRVAVAKQAGRQPELVAAAEKLLAEAPAQALQLARPGREYFTGLRQGADPGYLDAVREQAATLAGRLAGPATPLQARLTPATSKSPAKLQVTLAGAGTVRARYLVEHRPGWQEAATGGQGQVSLTLPAGGTITRCLVVAADDDGRLGAAVLPDLPLITVDSTMPPYRAEHLNDGLAMPGMKFEEQWGWISDAQSKDHWVELRLAAPAPLRGLRVWWMTFYGLPRAVKVQSWQAGAWQDAPGYEQWRPARAAVEELRFAPVTTARVRLLQQAGGGNSTFPTLMGASEVEVLR